MATLSRDNGSDWHASGVKRRDFRHIKDEPEIQAGAKNGPRKNTRIWCKGRVGTRHDVKFAIPTLADRWGGAYKCSRCGKRWYSRPDFAKHLPEARWNLRGSLLGGSLWEIVQSK